MAAPRASLDDIVNVALHIIGAAKLAAGVVDDNPSRYDKNGVIKVTRFVDREVASFIARTEGHPEQFDMFVYSNNIAHKGVLPESIAGYGNITVDGEKAKEINFFEIARIRTHETVSTDDILEEPYFKISGNKIYHTGTNAIVGYIPPVGDEVVALFSPAAYSYCILAGVLRVMFSKDGEDVGMSSDYAREYNARLAMIKDDAFKGIIREQPPLPQQG